MDLGDGNKRVDIKKISRLVYQGELKANIKFLEDMKKLSIGSKKLEAYSLSDRTSFISGFEAAIDCLRLKLKDSENEL